MRKEFVEVHSQRMAELMKEVERYQADVFLSVYPEFGASASEKLEKSKRELRLLEMECDDYDLLPEVKAEAIRINNI